MTDTHHHAAERDKRSGRKAEFLGTEQGRDRNIASRHKLAVSFEPDPAAQVI